MLISWIVVALGQLSVAGLPLVSGRTDVARPTPGITPGEPSTMVEALIGAAIIGAYLIFARRFRGRRGVPRVAKPTSVDRGRKAA
jgi:hypothetical protein